MQPKCLLFNGHMLLIALGAIYAISSSGLVLPVRHLHAFLKLTILASSLIEKILQLYRKNLQSLIFDRLTGMNRERKDILPYITNIIQINLSPKQ